MLLEDCGHTIEADGLREWLAQSDGEIGMKVCPKCKKPIYNNRRYYKFILKTFRDVEKVKEKYYEEKLHIQQRDISKVLEGEYICIINQNNCVYLFFFFPQSLVSAKMNYYHYLCMIPSPSLISP